MKELFKNSKIAVFVYGGMRPDNPKYLEFTDSLKFDDVKIVMKDVWLDGYRMYSTGTEPFIIETASTERNRVYGDIIQLSNRAYNEYNVKKIFDGFDCDIITINGVHALVYLVTNQMVPRDRFVESGDWNKHLVETYMKFMRHKNN